MSSRRKIGFELDARLARDLGDHLGQAVIGLRPHDHVDRRLARDDLLAFGLRDAARDREQHAASRFGPGGFQESQLAELGIDLLGRLFADVAGVEDHHVGVVGRVRPAA